MEATIPVRQACSSSQAAPVNLGRYPPKIGPRKMKRLVSPQISRFCLVVTVAPPTGRRAAQACRPARLRMMFSALPARNHSICSSLRVWRASKAQTAPSGAVTSTVTG